MDYDSIYIDMLSIGKAGEHLACTCLIKQGYNCFLSDQGLSYDILFEKNDIIKKMQVKSTSNPVTYGRSKNVYRFALNNGKGGTKRYNGIHYFAFACLDIMQVAFLKSSELMNKKGEIIRLIEFKSDMNVGGKGKRIRDYKYLR